MEILTASEVAAMLRISKRFVYELASPRGHLKVKHPLPVLRINTSVRFIRKEVEDWVVKIEENRP